jgi:hypothetical protein
MGTEKGISLFSHPHYVTAQSTEHAKVQEHVSVPILKVLLSLF